MSVAVTEWTIDDDIAELVERLPLHHDYRCPANGAAHKPCTCEAQAEAADEIARFIKEHGLRP